MADKKVMNDMDLENVSGGMRPEEYIKIEKIINKNYPSKLSIKDAKVTRDTINNIDWDFEEKFFAATFGGPRDDPEAYENYYNAREMFGK